MENSSLLSLLERVLTGRPGNTDKHSDSYQTLHSNLLSSSEAKLRAATITVQKLYQSDQITADVYSKFSAYLNAIINHKKPIPPNLSYLTFTSNPSCQKASKLFHALNKLTFKMNSFLKTGLESFKTNRFLSRMKEMHFQHYQELTQMKCKLMMADINKQVMSRLGKTLEIWRYRDSNYFCAGLMKILEKAELRWRYLKYISFERWVNEAWVEQEVVEDWADRERRSSIRKRKIKKRDSYMSIECNSLGEILLSATNKAQYLKQAEYESRVLALGSNLIKKDRVKEKLLDIVEHMISIDKSRKQLPITILASWTAKSSELSLKRQKITQGFERIKTIARKSKKAAYLKLKSSTDKKFSYDLKINLMQLLKNAIAISQAPRVSIEKMKRYESRYYQTKEKYTRSILSNLFRSSKSSQSTAFVTWKNFKSVCYHYEKTQKVKRLMEALNRSIKLLGKVPFNAPFQIKKKEDMLSRALILVCKNLRHILAIGFGKWLRWSGGMMKDKREIIKLHMKSLNKLLRGASYRQMKTAFNKITLLGAKLKKILKNLSTKIQNNLKTSIYQWKAFTKQKKSIDSLNHTRGLLIEKYLSSVPNRKLKLAIQRLTSFKNKLITCLADLHFSAKRKPKNAFDLWRHNSEKIRKMVMINKLKAERLSNTLRKISRKVMRSSFNRLIGTSPRVKLALKSVKDYIKLRMRRAVNSWVEFKKDCEHRETLQRYQIQKLQISLTRVYNRRVLTVLHRFILPSNKIKDSLLTILLKFKGGLSRSLNSWKSKAQAYSQRLLLKDSHQQHALTLLKSALYKPINNALKMLSTANNGKAREILLKLQRVYMKLPKVYFKEWNDFTNRCIKNKLKFYQLARFMDLVSKRTLKTTFVSIVVWQNSIRAAIMKINIAFLEKMRMYLYIWRSATENGLRKGAVFALKMLKAKESFERIVRRTIREASSRMMQGATRAEVTIEGLVNALKGIPRKGLRRWNKAIVGIIHQELLDNTKGIINLKLSLKALEYILRKIPKEGFDRWKNFCNDQRNTSIRRDYNNQLIKVCLEKIVKRTIKLAVESVKAKSLDVQWAIKIICEHLQKSPFYAFTIWKNHIASAKNNDIITGLKYKMLKTSLTSLCKKRFRDTLYRIIGGGDKVKGTIQGLVHGLNNIPKKALNKWNKTVQQIKAFEVRISLKATKLQSIMNKVTVRTLNEAAERIKGKVFLPLSLQGYLLNLANIRRRRPKQAFDRWKKFIFHQDKNNLLDQLRQAKLQLLLIKVSTRILRDCFMRVLGEGNKIKGAFIVYMAAIFRRPKSAFDKWKNYVISVKQQKLIDNLRSLRLNGCLERIVIRKLRDATQRILGGGDRVKGAIHSLVTGLRNVPLLAITKWTKVVKAVNEKKLMDNVRSEKLKGRLGKLVLSCLKPTFKKLTSNAGMLVVKSMISKIEKAAKSRPKLFFRVWKDNCYNIVKSSLKSTIRGQRIERLSESISLRTLKDTFNHMITMKKKVKKALSVCYSMMKKKPMQALNKLKNYSQYVKRKDLLSELAVEKLKNTLSRIGNKSASSFMSRITRKVDQPQRILQNVTEILKKKPKIALRKWHMNVCSIKQRNEYSKSHLQLKALKNIFIKMQKNYFELWKSLLVKPKRMLLNPKATILMLRKVLEQLLNRKNLHRFKSAKQFNQFFTAFKTSTRHLNMLAKTSLKTAFTIWQKFVDFRQNRELLFNLNSHKLKQLLEKTYRRKLRDSTQRILGEGNKIKGAIRTILANILWKPKSAFEIWKRYIAESTKKAISDKLRLLRFKEMLANLVKRTIRNACSLMCNETDKVKSALNLVVVNLTAKPKQVIKKWKQAVQLLREQFLMDFAKFEKLRNHLERITKRTSNELVNRITDVFMNSQIISYNIKGVNKIAQKRPKAAFRKWKLYVEEIKRKDLMNYIRSQNLAQLLGKACRKKLRDAFQRIIGGGDKMKGAIRTILSIIKGKCKDAFDIWRTKSHLISKKAIFDNLKIQKVKAALKNVTMRPLRNIFNAITSDDEKVKYAINTVVSSLQTKPKIIIKKWKHAVQLIRENNLIKDITSEKLKSFLEKLCKRTTREAFDRMIVILSNSIIANVSLKWINLMLQRRPKEALSLWRSYVERLKRSQLLKNLNSQKLALLMSGVSRRVLRYTYQCMLGDGDRVKGALKLIYRNILQKKHRGFINLRNYSEKAGKKIMMDTIRSAKLKEALVRLIVPRSRGLFQRIVGGGNIIKGAIKNLLVSFKAKSLHAIATIKNAVISHKLASAKLQSKGSKMLIYLTRLTHAHTKPVYARLSMLSLNNFLKVQRLLYDFKLIDSKSKAKSFNNFKANTILAKFSDKHLKTKTMLLMKALSKICLSLKHFAINKILTSNIVLKKLVKAFRNLKNSYLLRGLKLWKENAIQKRLSFPRQTQAILVLKRVCLKFSHKVFKILNDSKIIRRTISKIIRNQMEIQRSVLIALKEWVRKRHLMKKISAAYILLRLLTAKAKFIKSSRLKFWRNLEAIRIFRLKKKCIMKWIYMSSINYENSFWKMKYIWNKKFKYFDPRHALMSKNLMKIAGNYQMRLKQYAHFKLVMFTVPYSNKYSRRDSGSIGMNIRRKSSEYRALAFINKPESRARIERAMTPLGKSINKE